MAAPTFTALPTPPNRESSPETFSSDADAFLGALPQFQTDGNTIAAFCETEATTAETSASTAEAARNAAITARNAAQTAESNAATSATNAAASATSAAASAAAAQIGTVGDGSASSPSVTFTSDTNTGIFRAGSDEVAFSTGGTERMRIDASGNVGIGTSDPGVNLDLHAGSSGTDKTLFRTTTGGGGRFETVCSDLSAANPVWKLETGYGEQLAFGDSSGEFMRIDTSGHLIVPAGITLGTPSGVYNAANTLDDYEEGTWTPTVYLGGATLSSYSDSKYTKIGNLVTAWVEIQLTNITDYTIYFAGLPFTAGSADGSAIVHMYNAFGSTTDSVKIGYVHGNAQYITLVMRQNFTTDRFKVHISYQAA